MLNNLFQSILPSAAATEGLAIKTVLICTVGSLILGAIVALFYTFRNTYSKSFVVTLALLPAIVQMVIMLVNGNLGTGVAVMGAFSLIRFRSAPGSAREICSIFLDMAVGLATGMGYIGIAALFVAVIGLTNMLYTVTSFGEPKRTEKVLKVTIPEGLEYTGVFDDLFQEFTSKWELTEVKTADMGSLYKLNYSVMIKDAAREKNFIDEIRKRNGNLEIVCSKAAFGQDVL